MEPPRRAFLDANILRGQLTTDVMLSVAASGLYRPLWSEQVLAEVKRNRPPGVAPERVDARFAAMNRAFPEAIVSDYEQLMPEMRADEKDKHVLAGAVHSESHVLVTENVKDFDPPARGRNAMQVERASAFLNKLLEQEPARVIEAMNTMLARNRHDPRTMSALIDKMVTQQDLKGFARKLNEVVPVETRGTHPSLATGHSVKVALDGIAPPTSTTAKTTSTPETRKTSQPQTKNADREL